MCLWGKEEERRGKEGRGGEGRGGEGEGNTAAYLKDVEDGKATIQHRASNSRHMRPGDGLRHALGTHARPPPSPPSPHSPPPPIFRAREEEPEEGEREGEGEGGCMALGAEAAMAMSVVGTSRWLSCSTNKASLDP